MIQSVRKRPAYAGTGAAPELKCAIVSYYMPDVVFGTRKVHGTGRMV